MLPCEHHISMDCRNRIVDGYPRSLSDSFFQQKLNPSRMVSCLFLLTFLICPRSTSKHSHIQLILFFMFSSVFLVQTHRLMVSSGNSICRPPLVHVPGSLNFPPYQPDLWLFNHVDRILPRILVSSDVELAWKLPGAQDVKSELFSAISQSFMGLAMIVRA